jgi:uncharacterized repeat protein (TIGR01451 family)
MTFYQFIKPKLKKICGISIISALIAVVLMPVLSSKADGARFNFKDGDYELLRGVNKTADESIWKDPVTGQAGDEFSGLIYYHNGTEGTSASNTRISLSIPAKTTNGAAVLSATVSADNAETITDTVVNGQIIGQSGLTVILPGESTLELVPGSVKWFPDSYQIDNPIEKPLPNGQTGNEITGAGINLGTIEGCWQFAGFVKFSFKTKKIVTPKFSVAKEVRNVTQGENTFAKSTLAYNNNDIEFRINIENTGADPLNLVVSKDALPGDLTFVPGTFKKAVGLGATQDLTDAEFASFVGAGLSLGNVLNPNQTVSYLFRAKAPLNIVSEKTVTNIVTVNADNIVASDNASVAMKVTVANVIKHKTAANNTTQEVVNIDASKDYITTSFNASAGDEITYKLTTVSQNNDTDNFVIEDGIADILEYATVTNISDGGTIVTGTTGNNAMLVCWPAVNLIKDQNILRTFTVKVKNPLPTTPKNGTSFDDKMFNQYGDIVIVSILRPQPPTPEVKLKLGKTVRNLTASESNFVKSNEALAGDILEYNISFANSGNTPADQVKFSDVLPPNVKYISGTTVISFNGRAERTVIDGLAGNGIIVETIPAGDSGYLKFRVVTSTSIAAGEILTNTVFLDYKDQKLSDTAATKIKKTVLAPSMVSGPAPSLPRTGAAGGVSFVFTFVAGIAGTFARYRQLLAEKLEVIKVAKDIRSL